MGSVLHSSRTMPERVQYVRGSRPSHQVLDSHHSNLPHDKPRISFLFDSVVLPNPLLSFRNVLTPTPGFPLIFPASASSLGVSTDFQTKIVQEVSPALQRQREAAQKKVVARKATRKTEGVFTPPQVSPRRKITDAFQPNCGIRLHEQHSSSGRRS